MLAICAIANAKTPTVNVHFVWLKCKVAALWTPITFSFCTSGMPTLYIRNARPLHQECPPCGTLYIPDARPVHHGCPPCGTSGPVAALQF
ncbi:hypothetical protein FKM82_004898 [Ascaphus truei]